MSAGEHGTGRCDVSAPCDVRYGELNMRKKSLVSAGAILVIGVLTCMPAGGAAGKEPTDNQQDGKVAGAVCTQVAASFAQTARQHLTAGRLQEAIEDYTAALRFDPNFAAARDGLAEAQAKLRETEAAQEPEDAESAEDDLIRAQAGLEVACDSAERLMAEHDYKGAAEEFEKVLAGAETLSGEVDVSTLEARAGQGLRRALRSAAGSGDTKAAAPESKPAEEETELEVARKEVLRDVDRMMIPQVEILAKTSLPARAKDVFDGRRKDESVTQQISRDDFLSGEDTDGTNLIKAKLLKRITVDFKDQPFDRAIEHIRDVSGVNILVDPAVLPATGPVTLSATDMELRYALHYLLRFQKLDYRIRHGAIFISNGAGLAGEPITVTHDIADLTIKIRDFKNSMSQVMTAPRYGDEESSNPFGKTEEQDERLEQTRQGEEWARFIGGNIASGTWSGEGAVVANTIAYRNGKLVVTHTPEVQEQIRDLLASFRKARAIQVAILARFIEINQDFLDDLSFSWEGLGETTENWGIWDTGGSTNFLRARSAGTPEVGLSAGYLSAAGATLEAGFLNAWQVQLVVTAVRKQKQGNVLTAPRVTCFNTQRAYITVSTRSNFVRSYDSDGNPEIGQVNDGIVLEVQPFVSADRRYITLELIPQVNIVGDFQEFEFRREDDAVDEDEEDTTTTDTIQLPVVSTRQVMTTVSVPDGGTLMVGGLARATEAKGSAEVPFFADLPLIGALFKQRRTVDSRNNLIVLVTAYIIQQEED